MFRWLFYRLLRSFGGTEAQPGGLVCGEPFVEPRVIGTPFVTARVIGTPFVTARVTGSAFVEAC